MKNHLQENKGPSESGSLPQEIDSLYQESIAICSDTSYAHLLKSQVDANEFGQDTEHIIDLRTEHLTQIQNFIEYARKLLKEKPFVPQLEMDPNIQEIEKLFFNYDFLMELAFASFIIEHMINEHELPLSIQHNFSFKRIFQDTFEEGKSYTLSTVKAQRILDTFLKKTKQYIEDIIDLFIPQYIQSYIGTNARTISQSAQPLPNNQNQIACIHFLENFAKGTQNTLQVKKDETPTNYSDALAAMNIFEVGIHHLQENLHKDTQFKEVFLSQSIRIYQWLCHFINNQNDFQEHSESSDFSETEFFIASLKSNQDTFSLANIATQWFHFIHSIQENLHHSSDINKPNNPTADKLNELLNKFTPYTLQITGDKDINKLYMAMVDADDHILNVMFSLYHIPYLFQESKDHIISSQFIEVLHNIPQAHLEELYYGILMYSHQSEWILYIQIISDPHNYHIFSQCNKEAWNIIKKLKDSKTLPICTIDKNKPTLSHRIAYLLLNESAQLEKLIDTFSCEDLHKVIYTPPLWMFQKDHDDSVYFTYYVNIILKNSHAIGECLSIFTEAPWCTKDYFQKYILEFGNVSPKNFHIWKKIFSCSTKIHLLREEGKNSYPQHIRKSLKACNADHNLLIDPHSSADTILAALPIIEKAFSEIKSFSETIEHAKEQEKSYSMKVHEQLNKIQNLLKRQNNNNDTYTKRLQEILDLQIEEKTLLQLLSIIMNFPSYICLDEFIEEKGHEALSSILHVQPRYVLKKVIDICFPAEEEESPPCKVKTGSALGKITTLASKKNQNMLLAFFRLHEMDCIPVDIFMESITILNSNELDEAEEKCFGVAIECIYESKVKNNPLPASVISSILIDIFIHPYLIQEFFIRISDEKIAIEDIERYYDILITESSNNTFFQRGKTNNGHLLLKASKLHQFPIQSIEELQQRLHFDQEALKSMSFEKYLLKFIEEEQEAEKNMKSPETIEEEIYLQTALKDKKILLVHGENTAEILRYKNILIESFGAQFENIDVSGNFDNRRNLHGFESQLVDKDFVLIFKSRCNKFFAKTAVGKQGKMPAYNYSIILFHQTGQGLLKNRLSERLLKIRNHEEIEDETYEN